MIKTIKMEYFRRGRPLRKTNWGLPEISRWLRYHVSGKTQQDDIGAFGKYFKDPVTDEDMSPFPDDMLAWEKEHDQARVLHQQNTDSIHTKQYSNMFMFINSGYYLLLCALI